MKAMEALVENARVQLHALVNGLHDRIESLEDQLKTAKEDGAQMRGVLKRIRVVAARVSLVSDEEDDSTQHVETVALSDECLDELDTLLERLENS